MSAVQKRGLSANRHKRVAHEFFKWLVEHPKASTKDKISKLDQLSDIEWMRDTNLEG